jgi:hypothetical protein
MGKRDQIVGGPRACGYTREGLDPNPYRGGTGPVDSFAEGDPAAKRYAQLTDALSVTPTLTAIEIATIVRLVSWSTADDVLILSRIIRRSRRDAFEVGRLNAQTEAEGDTE